MTVTFRALCSQASRTYPTFTNVTNLGRLSDRIGQATRSFYSYSPIPTAPETTQREVKHLHQESLRAMRAAQLLRVASDLPSNDNVQTIRTAAKRELDVAVENLRDTADESFFDERFSDAADEYNMLLEDFIPSDTNLTTSAKLSEKYSKESLPGF